MNDLDDGWQLVDEWKILGIGTAGSGHMNVLGFLRKLVETRRNCGFTGK